MNIILDIQPIIGSLKNLSIYKKSDFQAIFEHLKTVNGKSFILYS